MHLVTRFTKKERYIIIPTNATSNKTSNSPIIWIFHQTQIAECLPGWLLLWLGAEPTTQRKLVHPESSGKFLHRWPCLPQHPWWWRNEQNHLSGVAGSAAGDVVTATEFTGILPPPRNQKENLRIIESQVFPRTTLECWLVRLLLFKVEQNPMMMSGMMIIMRCPGIMSVKSLVRLSCFLKFKVQISLTQKL